MNPIRNLNSLINFQFLSHKMLFKDFHQKENTSIPHVLYSSQTKKDVVDVFCKGFFSKGSSVMPKHSEKTNCS